MSYCVHKTAYQTPFRAAIRLTDRQMIAIRNVTEAYAHLLPITLYISEDESWLPKCLFTRPDQFRLSYRNYRRLYWITKTAERR